jgi:NodT family efflux transporter outer membrane factor (OMF) lipoprotein
VGGGHLRPSARRCRGRGARSGGQAGLTDVRRLVTAEVALGYIDLRDAQARLAITRENLATQQGHLEIAQWRNQAGLGNALDVEQAKTIVAQTRALVPPLEQAIDSALNRIDVLVGQAPGTGASLLRPVAPVPDPPAISGAGLPAELLQRRPDVLAARKRLEAEVVRIGVARAELYPALRLSGVLETSATSAGRLFDASAGSLIGGVVAPIFEGGQIRARIEQQRGSADVALAEYRAAILTALRDVDDALVSVDASARRETALQEAEASALSSLALADIQYRSGATDFQTLLDAQRSLLLVQESRAAARANRAAGAVQLFKALGGGWSAAAGP